MIRNQHLRDKLLRKKNSKISRSTLHALEEKQHLLERNFLKVKEHLKGLENKLIITQEQKKQTEMAIKDLRYAVGSLKKSIVSLEDGMNVYNSKKKSLLSNGRGSMNELRTSLNLLQKKMEQLAEDSKRKDKNITKIWNFIKSIERQRPSADPPTPACSSRCSGETALSVTTRDEASNESLTTRDVASSSMSSSSSSSLQASSKRSPESSTTDTVARRGVSSSKGAATRRVNGVPERTVEGRAAHPEVPLLAKFDNLRSKIKEMESVLEENLLDQKLWHCYNSRKRKAA